MSGRSRKSKKYSAPANTVPTVPYSRQHPQHAVREAECKLICQLIWSVYGTWLGISGNTQAEEDLEVIASTAKKILPKALASLIAEAEAEAAEEPDDYADVHGLPTIVWAAIRWIGTLDLPQDEEALWNGPPIRQRISRNHNRVS